MRPESNGERLQERAPRWVAVKLIFRTARKPSRTRTTAGLRKYRGVQSSTLSANAEIRLLPGEGEVTGKQPFASIQCSTGGLGVAVGRLKYCALQVQAVEAARLYSLARKRQRQHCQLAVKPVVVASGRPLRIGGRGLFVVPLTYRTSQPQKGALTRRGVLNRESESSWRKNGAPQATLAALALSLTQRERRCQFNPRRKTL